MAAPTAAELQPVFTLRCLSPVSLTQKTINSAKSIGFDQQLQLFYLFKFAAFGYPSFPAFDPQAPITVRVYENPLTKYTFPILFAKTAPATDIKKQFNALCFRSMSDGWIAVGFTEQSDRFLDCAAKSESPQELSAAPSSDIVLQIHSRFHARIRENFESLANASGATLPGTQNLLSETVEEIATLNELSIGADFSEKEIRARLIAHPQQQSPLFQLLCASSGGDIPMARAMPADAPLSLAFKMNPSALSVYSDHLFRRFQRHFDGVQADALENFRALTAAWLRTHEGGVASNYALRDLSMESESVYDGYCEGAMLKALLERTPDICAFIGELSFSGKAPSDFSASVTENPLKMDDVDSFQITFTAQRSSRPPPKGNHIQVRTRALFAERFVACVRHTQISATQLDNLRRIARAIADEKYPDNNLYENLTLPLPKGTFLHGSIDAPLILRDWLFYQAQQASHTPLSYALEKLSDEKLPRLKLRGTNDGGSAELDCSIPLQTLRRIIEILSQNGAFS